MTDHLSGGASRAGVDFSINSETFRSNFLTFLNRLRQTADVAAVVDFLASALAEIKVRTAPVPTLVPTVQKLVATLTQLVPAASEEQLSALSRVAQPSVSEVERQSCAQLLEAWDAGILAGPYEFLWNIFKLGELLQSIPEQELVLLFIKCLPSGLKPLQTEQVVESVVELCRVLPPDCLSGLALRHFPAGPSPRTPSAAVIGQIESDLKAAVAATALRPNQLAASGLVRLVVQQPRPEQLQRLQGAVAALDGVHRRLLTALSFAYRAELWLRLVDCRRALLARLPPSSSSLAASAAASSFTSSLGLARGLPTPLPFAEEQPLLAPATPVSAAAASLQAAPGGRGGRGALTDDDGIDASDASFGMLEPAGSSSLRTPPPPPPPPPEDEEEEIVDDEYDELGMPVAAGRAGDARQQQQQWQPAPTPQQQQQQQQQFLQPSPQADELPPEFAAELGAHVALNEPAAASDKRRRRRRGSGGAAGQQQQQESLQQQDEDRRQLRLQIVEQPPEKSVYKRNLKPNPAVMILGGGSGLGAELELDERQPLYVVPFLVRCDTLTDEPRFLTGAVPQRAVPGQVVSFKKLKVTTTSHQQQETLFTLRFELRRYVRGPSSQAANDQWQTLDEQHSSPINILSHSTQLRPLPSLAPSISDLVPSRVPCIGGARLAILGRDFVESPTLTVRVGTVDMSPVFHGPGTLIVHVPPGPEASRHTPVSVAVQVCNSFAKWTTAPMPLTYHPLPASPLMPATGRGTSASSSSFAAQQPEHQRQQQQQQQQLAADDFLQLQQERQQFLHGARSSLQQHQPPSPLPDGFGAAPASSSVPSQQQQPPPPADAMMMTGSTSAMRMSLDADRSAGVGDWARDFGSVSVAGGDSDLFRMSSGFPALRESTLFDTASSTMASGLDTSQQLLLMQSSSFPASALNLSVDTGDSGSLVGLAPGVAGATADEVALFSRT